MNKESEWIMKKVAIVTLYGNINHGNKLQNYALKKSLESIGCDVETLIINNPRQSQSGSRHLLLKSPKLFCKTMIRKTLSYIKVNLQTGGKSLQEIRRIRAEIFERFSSEFFNKTSYSISQSDYHTEKIKEFDYFVAGSDQVWNYGYLPIECLPLYFLDFAEQKKRISYAASFGISSISNEYHPLYKTMLNQMHSLSVREEAGAKIINDLTGREAYVHLDPTMLLTKEEWLKIAKPVKDNTEKKYILTYFLGKITTDYKKYIQSLAKSKKLEIINLGCIEENHNYNAGPCEFLDYINNAEIVITDSFHGTVFSILFEVPFVVLDRKDSSESMNSRLDTLLKLFRFESRSYENLKAEKDAFEIDFSHTYDILSLERQRSMDYLKNALLT